MASNRHQRLNADRKPQRRSGIEEARLLDPSYSASHSQSSLRRTSAELTGGTYFDSSGLAHDSSYNPYDGLANLNGRRNHKAFSRVGGAARSAAPSVTDSEDDRFDRMGLGRSGSARTAHSSRRINRPASEMSLPINGGGGGAYGEHHPPLPVSHGVGGVGADGRRSSHYQQQPSHLSSSSTVASSSRDPTTTTATKSRRSTLLSQATTVYTDYPTSEEEEILAPPAPTRYNASSFAAINKNTYPSPPSSVVSSVSPQLFPETPAQAKARRQQEQAARPVLPTPARAPPPLSTTLGGGGLGGGSTYGGGGGGYSEKGGGGSTTSKGGSYVPSRWRDEKKGKIGAVEEEYRPPVEDKDWTPGCADNLKRSWGEISLAVRFGVFRTKKKLERGIRH